MEKSYKINKKMKTVITKLRKDKNIKTIQNVPSHKRSKKVWEIINKEVRCKNDKKKSLIPSARVIEQLGILNPWQMYLIHILLT